MPRGLVVSHPLIVKMSRDVTFWSANIFTLCLLVQHIRMFEMKVFSIKENTIDHAEEKCGYTNDQSCWPLVQPRIGLIIRQVTLIYHVILNAINDVVNRNSSGLTRDHKKELWNFANMNSQQGYLKVYGTDVVTLNWMSIFGWYIARLVVKNRHWKGLCHNEIFL